MVMNMPEEMISLFIGGIIPYMFIVCVFGGCAAYFASKRDDWYTWEIAPAFLPFVYWFVLISYNSTGKGFGNLAVEPFYLGLLISLIILSRSVLSKFINKKAAATYFVILGPIAAFAIWHLVPGLSG